MILTEDDELEKKLLLFMETALIWFTLSGLPKLNKNKGGRLARNTRNLNNSFGDK